MIEPCFNELSLFPLCDTDKEADSCVTSFIDLLKELEQFGIKRTRYEKDFTDIKLQNNYSLYDYCNDPKNRNYQHFLYSHMRRPYMDEEAESSFFAYSDYKFITDDGNELDCIGLYVSYVTNSFSVGFNAGLFENEKHVKCNLSLTKNGIRQKGIVCCLTLPRHIDSDLFVELMSDQPDLPVPLCETKPSAKRKHIPDHHGKAECEAHAERLVECKYVKEILNSIDFDGSEKKYIHKVDAQNLIEVRLPNTKKGYGLCVSTTATNRIQNWWIAKHLKKNYGK